MKVWVYKLHCPECGHSEIDEFLWECCPVCGAALVVVDQWPGGL